MSPETLKDARKLLCEELRKRCFHVYPAADKHGIFGCSAHTSFKLSFMPGNRRTLISHGAQVEPEHRGKGIGTVALMDKEYAAAAAGVTLMLATVMHSNVAEIKVLKRRRWKELTRNDATGCSLWGKQLPESM